MLTGKAPPVVPACATTTGTSVQAVALPLTELKITLELRKLQALTPYKPKAWEFYLSAARLSRKYPFLPQSFCTGFILDYPIIKVTQTPPNKPSISDLQHEFDKVVRLEMAKQCYLGPLSCIDMESLIGPFQSSSFSIIPKPGRPGHYRILQNYSFPYIMTSSQPNPSINSFIDSNNFPTTWGTFSIIALLIHQLPLDPQVATRDVVEAYRTIPLHHLQWPGAVAKIGPDSYCVDTAT